MHTYIGSPAIDPDTPQPWSLDPTPYTLNCKPCSLNPKSQCLGEGLGRKHRPPSHRAGLVLTLEPTPCTLHPKPFNEVSEKRFVANLHMHVLGTTFMYYTTLENILGTSFMFHKSLKCTGDVLHVVFGAETYMGSPAIEPDTSHTGTQHPTPYTLNFKPCSLNPK